MSTECDIALPRIKDAEGYRMYPYRDTLGVNTIGYGCALDVGWPEPFAAAVVKLQVENAAMECQSLPFWSDLDTLRRSAVIEMVFNLGMTKFLQFRKLIAALQKKDYVAAAREMISSKWAQQVRGRAIRLAHIVETGVDAPC